MSDILVVGCGFAGFWSAVAARRVLGAEASITVVAPRPLLVIRVRLYQADPTSLAVDVTEHLDSIGVEFVAATALGLDQSSNEVVTDVGPLPYRRLIAATGSVLRRPPIPGAEATLSIDQLDDAIEFDRQLAAAVKDNPRPTIAVIGAGFTGIELALELRDRIARHASAAVGEQAQIVLIDRSPVVGAELGAGPRPVIETALRNGRIELRLGSDLARIEPGRITFSDGSDLDADVVVLTTGMTASPFTAALPGERDRLGRVVVDTSLACMANPTIFVTGDAAHADTGNGLTAMQSCQHALQLGRYAGENAARSILGQPAIPYGQLHYVTCLDLGRSGAVITEGWDRTVTQVGAVAKLNKVRINTESIYPPTPGDALDLLRASEIF